MRYAMIEKDLWLYIRDNRKSATLELISSRILYVLPIKRRCSKKGAMSHKDALQRSRSFEATNPRDHRYALLGLCDIGLLTQPDYSEGVLEVRREVVIKLLFPQLSAF